MSVLDSLQSSLASARAELEAKKRQAEAYRAKAQEIGMVYEELKEKKKSMRTLKSNVEDFKDTKYDAWKGNLWKQEYKGSGEKVVASYDTVIQEIDTNMDNLNLEKTRYENLANDCYGIIGRLASTINSLLAQIENCVN